MYQTDNRGGNLPFLGALVGPRRRPRAVPQSTEKQTYPQVEKKVKKYLAAGYQAKAGLIVLPELFLFDLWPIGSKQNAADVVKTFTQYAGNYAALIKSEARTNHTLIVGGSVPRLVDGKLFNSAVIGFPDGRIFFQDKLHLTPWEVQMGFSPGTELKVFEEPWGKFAVLICYDLEIPQISALLAPIQPELIISPSMTEDKNGLARVRAAAKMRAVEQLAYVALVGTVGNPSPSFPNRAKALFAYPPTHGMTGTDQDGAEGQAGLTLGHFDFALLKEARKKPDVNPARDGAAAKFTVRNVK